MVVVVEVEEAGIVVVETGAMAIVTNHSIRDRTTMAHNHTAMAMVVQATEEATTEAMEEADMAEVVDMVEVEVGIHINRIHTTRGLHTNRSHPLIPMEALEVMEGEVGMEAMEGIQLTQEAMLLATTPMILVLVADTTALHLSKIAIALTEVVVVVDMADTVDMAQHHPSPRQVIHLEEVRLIVAMCPVVGVEVGDRLRYDISRVGPVLGFRHKIPLFINHSSEISTTTIQR